MSLLCELNFFLHYLFLLFGIVIHYPLLVRILRIGGFTALLYYASYIITDKRGDICIKIIYFVELTCGNCLLYFKYKIIHKMPIYFTTLPVILKIVSPRYILVLWPKNWFGPLKKIFQHTPCAHLTVSCSTCTLCFWQHHLYIY